MYHFINAGKQESAEPARRERAEHVAVGDERDVAAGAEGLVDDAIDAASDVLGGLAAGAAVAPQVPVGPLLSDLRGRDPLVLAVVELDQVVAKLGRQAGELRGLPRARQRRRQHERELAAGDPLP